MIKQKISILEATQHWVRGFNAIPQLMIAQLMTYDPESWSEITLPTVSDSVFVYEKSMRGEIIARNDSTYVVKFDNGDTVTLTSDNFDVIYDYDLPIWGTMWSFDDSADISWLETQEGLAAMSECGFRIVYHEDFGYFFGLDGAGYDFYSEHWIPLYLARGLHWHN